MSALWSGRVRMRGRSLRGWRCCWAVLLRRCTGSWNAAAARRASVGLSPRRPRRAGVLGGVGFAGSKRAPSWQGR